MTPSFLLGGRKMEKKWWGRFASGIGIGAAFIVPGIDGGSVAVITGVYDGLVEAIGSFRKRFRDSFAFILPIFLGFLVGFGAMFFPLKYALQYCPFPTIALFSGFTLGSLPSLFTSAKKKGFSRINLLSLALPFAGLIGLCFVPSLGAVDLSTGMPLYRYFLIVSVGIIGAGALVVPGVSGSMVLLILGYYQPIVGLLSGIAGSPLHNLLLLALFAIGVLIGLVSLSKLMAFFLRRFPRGTAWAIFSFVAGSVVAVLLSFDYAHSSLDGGMIVVGVFSFIVGAIFSFALKRYFDEKAAVEEKA